MKGGCKENRAKLFSEVSSNRTRHNGHKLKYKGFYLNIRKHFFSAHLTEKWPREALESTSIQNPSGHGPGKPALDDPA